MEISFMPSPQMVNQGTLRKKFQGFDLSNAGSLVFSAHKGIKPSVFYSFADLIKMSEKTLAGLLSIHPRTIGNYRDQQKKLAPRESEHLLKVIALFAQGEEIFGNIDEFNYWLQKPFWDIKEKPIDWLITSGGVDLVSDELKRLAHGYAV